MRKILERNRYLRKENLPVGLGSKESSWLSRKQEVESMFRNIYLRGDDDSNIVGTSKALFHIRALIDKVKDSDAPVFIIGESGTGKELIARTIHEKGARGKGEFVAINCGAIPDLLLESELFGHVRGAFTGAIRNKPGIIEEANGGTFFLDEIGDLVPHLQAKLLRLLQEKEIRRVGENRTRSVDVRFMSATNKNLEKEIERGNFREDLYYRLKIISVELPPLRERKEDIFHLLNYYIKKYCVEMKREQALFSPQAVELLLDYPWPGNVRELQNEIQRCLILSGENSLIKEESLSSRINPKRTRYSKSSYDFFRARAEFERRFLNQAMARWNYNRAMTAEKIGISRQGLFKLIKKLNIDVPKGG
ncbi:MAG: sigma-54-dependent Fis family transcriptional regulator [Candidatus Aminicenantes bacterium]|nr:MAG: sigma-54-dependent Fis family transcriptional regulator [Candidatus Aminicenantes bacterium]